MATPVWTTNTLPDQYNMDFNKRYFDKTIEYLKGPNTLLKRAARIVPTDRPYWKGTITTLRGNWGEADYRGDIYSHPPTRGRNRTFISSTGQERALASIGGR